MEVVKKFLSFLSSSSEAVETWTTILANIVSIVAVIQFVRWVLSYHFEKKKKEIDENLVIRKSITENLVEHADQYDRSKPNDIGIRLVYWKNYPRKLNDDGYKQALYYDTGLEEDVYRDDEFLTNTGILVEEHPWFYSQSLYLGKFGTFIIDKSNKKIAGFEEVNQKIKLIRTLKYEHIINWDFKKKIEYEPVFYTRYKYTDKRLYENKIIVQSKYGRETNDYEFYKEDLKWSNQVKSNLSIKYFFLWLIGYLKL